MIVMSTTIQPFIVFCVLNEDVNNGVVVQQNITVTNSADHIGEAGSAALSE